MQKYATHQSAQAYAREHPAGVNGISFLPTATRNTWPLIRDYLVTQCGMSLVQ